MAFSRTIHNKELLLRALIAKLGRKVRLSNGLTGMIVELTQHEVETADTFKYYEEPILGIEELKVALAVETHYVFMQRVEQPANRTLPEGPIDGEYL